MTMKERLLIFILSLFIVELLFCQIITSNRKGNFELFNKTKSSQILFDINDDVAVKTSISLFKDDIKNVSGNQVQTITNVNDITGNIVIVGSLDNSKIIKNLITQNLLDTLSMNGKWEKYSYQIIKNPWKRGTKAFVVFGSDKRGTAFGLLDISRQLGVSPWYWWADIPVKKLNSAYIKDIKFKSKSPDIKYRGIFLNDEDWGLLPWSKKNFEKEVGDIGPKTYSKICELLLRLKANYLWPAMHECTGAFNKYPENKVVANKYGIVMGSSHCEPLLYNNATEWNTNKMGEWNYATNKKQIYNVLNERVKENAQYENVYTVGMRGIHDHPLVGNYPLDKQIELVENAIADERKILTNNIKKDIKQIPQIMVPYAEILDLYNNGLKIPDDITIMWVDDNYGYIRRLSNPIEQKRSGGSGVYYHIAYLGNPHAYTWLSTTNPALIYQEMKKSYDYGADRIWIANVGDLKPAEYNTQLFLDLGWNISTLTEDDLYSHLKNWYEDIYGKEIGNMCYNLMYEYYQINFVRKPEFMGWGQEYASSRWKEQIEDTDFSFIAYNEIEKRLDDFQKMNIKVDKINKRIPQKLKPSFFELLYYPIKTAYYINKKLLIAQKNRWYAKLGHASTNDLIYEVKTYQDSAKIITDEYNSMLNGKWKYMMSSTQTSSSTYALLPPTKKITLPKKSSLGIIVEENFELKGINLNYSLPEFSSLYPNDKYHIDVYNKGQELLKWNAKSSSDWIILSKSNGITSKEQRIYVSIDWNKIKDKEERSGTITFESGDKYISVFVKAFNPQINKEELKNTFVEKNGYISIPLEKFNRKIETQEVKWIIKKGLGITGNSVGTSNNMATTVGHWAKNDSFAHLEYDFYTFNSGRFDIISYVLPTYPINGFLQQRYAVCVDNGVPQMVYAGAEIDSDKWRDNVRRNSSKHKTSHYIDKPGKHVMKIYFMEPGVVLDKAVIDFGGLKKSYLGPETTFIK